MLAHFVTPINLLDWIVTEEIDHGLVPNETHEDIRTAHTVKLMNTSRDRALLMIKSNYDVEFLYRDTRWTGNFNDFFLRDLMTNTPLSVLRESYYRHCTGQADIAESGPF